MRFILVIILLVAGCCCGYAQQNKVKDVPEFIEIKHLGVEEKPINIIYVSVKKLRLNISGDSALINGQKSMRLNEEDRWLIEYHFYTMFTLSQLAFNKLKQAVDSYPYNTIKKPDPKLTGYAIVINGISHYITYKQTASFFAYITRSLKVIKGGRRDAKDLVAYINEFLPQYHQPNAR
ncbi:hypothetical protein C8P68_102466 [Mucilaginibacter yixingensis]|uniref:Uncharacterized protein n=1 Tax=Mucilaginibacter yixingensis TaxID=1295612 RepID=A0A2T5JCZ8_9SPHI|nr:hypothetical protein [Mucilaginibacter yixingensis]PTQ99639.1 hypothetical protein C8P68_102466 [Mucilaginibacter yixingensis]